MRLLLLVVLLGGACTDIPAVDAVRWACSQSAPCGAGFECQAGVCVERGTVADATGTDASDDTNPDDTGASDTGSGDVGLDVPSDSGPDAAPDVSDDSGSDTGDEVAPDTSDDAAPDASGDASDDAADDATTTGPSDVTTDPGDASDAVEVVTCVPAAELCNGLDDNCDGDSDEGFSLGVGCDGGDSDACANGILVCDPADPTRARCDESGATNATERCDGLDNDCDGDTDEGFGLGATCSVGVGVCAAQGVTVCATPTTVACSGDGQPTTTACDDGQACTFGDHCSGGPSSSCAGQAYTCDGACRSCDGLGGCAIAGGNCYIDGACRPAATVSPSNPCDMCRPGLSKVAWSPPPGDGNPCDDQDACTDHDTCVGQVCKPGPPRDADGDGHADQACGGDDCDDALATVYPGASERCDGLVNDCGQSDALEPCVDKDGDGYCAEATGPQGADAPCPAGGDDCNDDNAFATPAAAYPCATFDNAVVGRSTAVGTLFLNTLGNVQALVAGDPSGRMRRLGFSGLTVAANPAFGASPRANPLAVVQGPDDKVYFAAHVDWDVSKVRVGRLAGSTLEAERTFGLPRPESFSASRAPAMALGPDGHLFIAYRDVDGLAWLLELTPTLRVVSREVVAVESGNVVVVSGGLWVGPTGVVRLVGFDETTMKHRLLTRATDGTWTATSSAVGDLVGLDATWDASGNVYACAPASDGSAVTYLATSGGVWSRTALPGSAVSFPFCSLEVTASASHVVFGARGSTAYHSRKSVGAWSTNEVPQVLIGDSLSTVVDGSGALWLLLGQSYVAKFSIGWQISARLDPSPCGYGAQFGTSGGKSVVGSDGVVHTVMGASGARNCYLQDGAFVEQMTTLPASVGYFDAIALESAGSGKLALAYGGLGTGSTGTLVQAQRQGGSWGLVGTIDMASGTSALTVDSAITSSGTYYVAYSTRFPYVVRLSKSAGVGTLVTTDPTWSPLATGEASWPDLAMFADPTPRLAVCASTGVHVYTSSGSSWVDATVSATGCFRMRAWSDGGTMTLSWLDANYSLNYAFESGGTWESYVFPNESGSEPYTGLAAMPGPTTLFAGNRLLPVPDLGAFAAFEPMVPAGTCFQPQPLETPGGLVISCAGTGTFITLEP